MADFNAIKEALVACDLAKLKSLVEGALAENVPAADILNDMVEQAADILTKVLPETVTVK